jgi:ketosteroid isomerase-like protein
MHFTSRRSPLALVLLVLVACASSRPLVPGDPEEVLRAFVAALNHADVDAVTDLLDPDATAFLPLDSAAAELVGREAICDTFATLFRDLRQNAAGPEYMHLVPKSVHTRRAGDGLAIVTFDAGAGPVVSRRTLVIQRTQAGWRIMHFHGSNVRTSTIGAGA